MKKHYIRITTVITSLILATFLVAGGFYWYACAVKIMNERMEDLTENSWINHPEIGYTDMPYDEMVKYVYSEHWRYNDSLPVSDHLGYYGRLILGDGRVFEPRDFIYVFRCDAETDYLLDNTRIIFPDETPSLDYENCLLWGVSIDAMCDDAFVYDGNMHYCLDSLDDSYDVSIPTNEYASREGEMAFSDWIGDVGLEARYISMAHSKETEKLNAEAAEILDDYIDGHQGEFSLGETHKSLTTSYHIIRSITVYDYENKAECYSIYVFHPLKIAVQEHIPVFVLGLLALIVIEGLVIFFMRRLYRDRMDFELRSRDLTRSIAHDLKTPLAVTQAYVENWEYIDEKDRHEYSEKLGQEVDNMNKMVTELLKMQKMDSGEQQLHLEEVELASLAESVYNQIRTVAEERGLDVTIVKDDRNASYLVNADLEMIRIVMSNFISNAVKYADSKVKIKLMANDKNVTFMVSNDGEPMSNSELKKVWDAFYKKDNSRTDRIGSSGMGLAISRSILKLHKAKFGAVGDGSMTSFWFRMKRMG